MAKSKYETHVLPYFEMIKAWCRDGASDEFIYTNLKISKDSFYEYKKKHSDFSDTLKDSKEIIDAKVENALLKRALGYKFDEITKERAIDPTTAREHVIVTKIVTKEVQPDTTAQIFWLKNRKSNVWRDKQEVEHSGKVGIEEYIKKVEDNDEY
ncbi:MAG: transposase [Clostridia bacterium]